MSEADGGHDPYRALRFRDFRLLLIGSCIAQFGQQMLTVALGWEIYDRTGSTLVLDSAYSRPIRACEQPLGTRSSAMPQSLLNPS